VTMFEQVMIDRACLSSNDQALFPPSSRVLSLLTGGTATGSGGC
jgi:hypothetical protein